MLPYISLTPIPTRDYTLYPIFFGCSIHFCLLKKSIEFSIENHDIKR